MYYNRAVNDELIRLWQLEQALHNMGGTRGASFSDGTYETLCASLRAEIKTLTQSIDKTVEVLEKRNGGTLGPII